MLVRKTRGTAIRRGSLGRDSRCLRGRGQTRFSVGLSPREHSQQEERHGCHAEYDQQKDSLAIMSSHDRSRPMHDSAETLVHGFGPSRRPDYRIPAGHP